MALETIKESARWYISLYDDAMWKDTSYVESPPANVMERWWKGVTNTFTEAQIFLCFYFIVVAGYLILASVFAFFAYMHWFESYKIQKKREWPAGPAYTKCLKNIMFNYCQCAFPLAVLSFPIMKKFGLVATLPLPPLTQFIWHIFVFLVAEDFLHYFLHRLLHIPFLYTHIHKVHHEFSAPIGLAASYSTATEMLILAIPTFLPAMLIAPHFITFYSWFVLRQIDAVLRHCGYDFPDPLNIIPYYGGTIFHDYHHQSFVWNYASRFTYLDKIFSTYKEVPHVDTGKSTMSKKQK